MTTLTVTAEGQVTFARDLLQHLGIRPGERINVDILPDGRAVIQAAPAGGGDIAQAFGILKNCNTEKIALDIDQMGEIASEGWAGESS